MLPCLEDKEVVHSQQLLHKDTVQRGTQIVTTHDRPATLQVSSTSLARSAHLPKTSDFYFTGGSLHVKVASTRLRDTGFVRCRARGARAAGPSGLPSGFVERPVWQNCSNLEICERQRGMKTKNQRQCRNRKPHMGLGRAWTSKKCNLS